MKTIESIQVVTIIGVLTATLGLTGCERHTTNNQADQTSRERTAGEAIDDKSLTSRVKEALDADSVHKYPDLKVTAFKGTVQLSGFVNLDEQKARAAELAKGVVGVKEVENHITVKK